MSVSATSHGIEPVRIERVVIEPMTEADIEHVRHIDQASSLGSWSAETYRRELASGVSYVIARATGPVPPAMPSILPVPPTRAGASLFTFLKRAFKRIPAAPRPPILGYGGVSIIVDEAHILALAVYPSCRRQGIGDLILKRLIATARERGATLLTLEVRASNLAAQQLYRKYGFLPVGHRPGYYAETGEDAIIMTVEPVPHLP